MHWTLQSHSEIGGRSEQQDRALVLSSDDGMQHLLLVADGAGGHLQGALAAQTVIDFARQQAALLWQAEDPETALETFCQHAHVLVLELAKDGGMVCSTIVVLLLKEQTAYWAHVGDSRLYLVRDGKCHFRTTDHSLQQLLRQKAVDNGALNNAAEVGSNQLYMCLGAEGDLLPEVGASVLRAGDSFILCSDGLWGQFELDPLMAQLGRRRLAADCAYTWVKQSCAKASTRGDNSTLILARLEASPWSRLRNRLQQWLG